MRVVERKTNTLITNNFKIELSLIHFCDITKGLILGSENQVVTAKNQIYINKEQKDEHKH